MLRIQLASDIHLEQNPGLTFADVITPVADVLVLAGDIGCPAHHSYADFIKAASRAFKHVVLITGNHEYRTCAPHTMEDTDAHIAALCRPLGNVHYLANGANVTIGDLNFIGATLWSNVPIDQFTSEQQAHMNATWQVVSRAPGVPWTPAEGNRVHAEHLAAIERAVNAGCAQNKKNVIVTHHAPLLNGPFKRDDFPRNTLYATDLTNAFLPQYMSAWLFGHTHFNYMSVHNGVFVASNQYGAKGISGWNRSFALSL